MYDNFSLVKGRFNIENNFVYLHPGKFDCKVSLKVS